MPVCFQLYKKSAMEEGPQVLQRIDEDLCKHFEQPVDEKKWFCDWYDCIGFRLACGKTFGEIRAQFKEYIVEDTARGNPDGAVEYYTMAGLILDYLEEHYTPNSFYENSSITKSRGGY